MSRSAMAAGSAPSPEAVAAALRRGDSDSALALVHRALSDTPDHTDLWRLLGDCAAAAGRPGEAVDAYRRVARDAPDDADVRFNLGRALSAIGEFDAAAEAYRESLGIRPGWHDALYNLGNVLVKAGSGALAEDAYRKALARRPDHIPTRTNLAVVMRRAGDAAGAERLLSEGLVIAPDTPGLYAALGLALRDQRRWAEAADAFQRAGEGGAGADRALFHLGLTRKDLGDDAGAAAAYRSALAINPAMVDAAVNLAALATAGGREGEAVEVLRTAYRHRGDDPDLLTHLGNALQREGDIAAAEQVLRKALELAPDSPAAFTNLGVVLNAQGRHNDARECFSRALSLAPDMHEARFNHGQTCLLLGDFKTGWRDYDSRLDKTDWKHVYPYRYALRRWAGEPFTGRRLYIHDEQGFGDTLQFVRYLPRVKALGGTVILETRPPLVRLLTGLPGADQVVARPATGRPAVPADLQASLMSLPRIFDTRADTIPADIPYLRPPADAHRWKAVVAGDGLKAALVWAGNPNHQNDARRSLPPDLLAPLARVTGVSLFSLQKGPAADALDGAGLGNVPSLGPMLGDFADTAACLSHMDLVITVDTAVAHLAGAMGRPTWLLLPRVPDWRWQCRGDDSPWYPGMRLFRQGDDGRWAPVVARVAEALRQAAQAFSGTDDGRDAHAVMRAAYEDYRTGRLDAARGRLTPLVDGNAGDGAALNLMAAVAFREGRVVEALEFADAAVAEAPENIDFLVNRGRILATLGRPEAAVDAFAAALHRHPGHRDAALALGDLLVDSDRPEAAIAPVIQALRQQPADTAMRRCLSRVLRRCRRAGDAADVCREGLRRAPDHPDLHVALGLALADGGRHDDARAAFDRALAVDPGHVDALHNLGVLHMAAGRWAQAASALEALVSKCPDHAGARFNLGQIHLLQGRFDTGWEGYRWRMRTPAWRRRYPGRPGVPAWDGRPFPGRRICVRHEQGLGDTLQFVRYLPMVKALGGTVVLETAPVLHGLLRGVAGIDELVAPAPDRMPPADCHLATPLMGLPGLFGTRADTIPADVPYIQPPAAAVSAWRHRVPADRRVTAGLVWAGNPAHANDAARSLSPATLRPMLSVEGVRWVGLQYGTRGATEALPPPLRFDNLGDGFTDFCDTAGVIAGLDLVVTVDTAVAHLAGAMGKPVWVMVPFVPDWRWQLDREDSPWYPTMRLFRQRRAGDWHDVVSRMAQALKTWCNQDTECMEKCAP